MKGGTELLLKNIGIMIGVYIITRMVSFLTRKNEKAESLVVKIFAIITIIVTIIVILNMYLVGGPPTP
jgi:heme/copper-type cytochrome/quinol oxidase subunit 4